MDQYQLSERDICTKFITPAIQRTGWQQHQLREEVNLTDCRVMVWGKLAARVRNPEAKGGPKRTDFVLYARPNLPIAVVETKQAKFSVPTSPRFTAQHPHQLACLNGEKLAVFISEFYEPRLSTSCFAFL